MDKTYIILLLSIIISTFFLTKTFNVNCTADLLFILLIVYLYNKHKMAAFGIFIIYLSVRNNKSVKENFYIEEYPSCIVNCLKGKSTITQCVNQCKNKCMRNCSKEFPNSFSSCGDMCSDDTTIDDVYSKISIKSTDVSNKCMSECLKTGETLDKCIENCSNVCMKKCVDKEQVVCTEESNNSCIASSAGSFAKCYNICV
jgi:hypothetical protein